LDFSTTGNKKDEVFILGRSHQNLPRNLSFFFIHKNDKWILQDSTIVDLNIAEQRWVESNFWVSPEGNLYSVGNGMYKWDGQRWNQLQGNTPGVGCLQGTGESNLFAAGSKGGVYHYNGADWYQYKQFVDYNVGYADIWTDGKEVFIVGTDGYKTMVLHGK
jgi:hypothetical protein